MSKVEELNIKVRGAIEDDQPFIYSSWLHSYRESRSTSGIQNEIFYTGQHKVITSMLSSCKTVVLCDNTDLGHIYGFGVGEEINGVFTLHYIYVKHPYRGLGLAKLIFKHLGGVEDIAFCYTHRTKKAEFYDRQYSNAIYHPYLAFRHYVLGESNEQQQQEKVQSSHILKEKKEKIRRNNQHKRGN